MNVWLLGALVVGGAALAAGAIALIQQKFSPPQTREPYNEVAGSVFEIVSVLYAIVLAFVLIAVWEQMSEAQRTTYNESAALVEVYWDAQGLPDAQRVAIQDLCADYANEVINTEWPQMRAHETVDNTGWQIADRIRATWNTWVPDGDEQNALMEDGRDQIRVLYDARSERLATASDGLSGVMWLVMIAGAVLVMGVLFLFGIPGRAAHLAVVTAAASMIALLLFSVYELEYPYSRAIAVGSDAFQLALDRFSHIG
ncbi:hypothetical protein Afil01_08790 [Actinorhabdospora filicis]|uniref:DUF4239 domain-containing protein n=1 Tax=Actinorhabdospora filicis TaxID=1785913 RepID=A0A9W6W1M9_9ACTN|nr:DUF4239 domain-containing protein [Actinorhabdospora filicis]GLZ76072.1 hypothetical protein Afil01_08790 [Actinorhabdospora filicis]